MNASRARSFAIAIATRRAARWPHVYPVARSLVHPFRPVLRRGLQQTPGGRMQLVLTHRLAVDDRVTRVVNRTHAIVQRIERHVASTRHVIERTQRVEQVPLRGEALRTASATARGQAALPSAAPIIVPQLPRVLRRASTPPSYENARAPESRTARTVAPSMPPIDVARLTDEVMRGIDKRLAAWRERRGRV